MSLSPDRARTAPAQPLDAPRARDGTSSLVAVALAAVVRGRRWPWSSGGDDGDDRLDATADRTPRTTTLSAPDRHHHDRAP